MRTEVASHAVVFRGLVLRGRLGLRQQQQQQFICIPIYIDGIVQKKKQISFGNLSLKKFEVVLKWPAIVFQKVYADVTN